MDVAAVNVLVLVSWCARVCESVHKHLDLKLMGRGICKYSAVRDVATLLSRGEMRTSRLRVAQPVLIVSLDLTK